MRSSSKVEVPKLPYNPDHQFRYGNNEFINYRVIGNGSKAIVFLHGFGASNRTWDDIIAYLSLPDTRLIFVDLIGAGFSSKSRGADQSMRANARVVEAFVRELGLHDYALAGHSFGGGVALNVTVDLLKGTARGPSALLLLDAAAYETKLPFFIRALKIALLPKLLFALAPSDLLARYTLNRLYFDRTKVTDEKVQRYSFFMSMPGNNDALVRTARQISPQDWQHAGRYKEIRTPTLVLWGRQDTVLALEQGARLSKEIPSARLAIIEDSGHNIQEEQPREVARRINEFLDEVWA